MGMKKQLRDSANTLNFNSIFESGNLDMAIKINELEYDLYMRVDSNTKGLIFNFFLY